MRLIEKIFTPGSWGTAKIQEAAPREAPGTVSAEESMLRDRIRILESQDSGLASIRMEDYLWSPVAGWQVDSGFNLATIQDEADHCRALYAINPLIKKAVGTRVGMIHGRGVRILPVNENQAAAVDRENELHSRRIFGDVARARLEAELSSTGNVWAIRERGKAAVTVPIAQIAGYVSDVDDPSTVLYWRRTYQAQETSMLSGQSTTVIVNEYIPTSAATQIPSEIGDVPVRRGARMVHIAANRQENWVLGLPDVFAAKFWTKGHKEMFEAGHEFALAQGQYAAKVTGGSNLGTQMAASRLADAPRRDYETGEYGGTFLASQGMDFQLMGKMGSGVDFKSYDRIAGLIASAVGIPVAVLLSESPSEEISLEASVVEDMRLRQRLWTEFYEDFFDVPVTVVWPRIKQETLYRTNQSVEISNRTNTLSAPEKRLVTLEAYGLDGDPDEVPDIADHPDVMVHMAKKEIDFEFAKRLADAGITSTGASAVSDRSDDEGRTTTPDQGKDTGIGKLSDGADAKDARDAGELEHTR